MNQDEYKVGSWYYYHSNNEIEVGKCLCNHYDNSYTSKGVKGAILLEHGLIYTTKFQIPSCAIIGPAPNQHFLATLTRNLLNYFKLW